MVVVIPQSIFLNYVESVKSVEYDHEWFNIVQAKLPSNAKLIFIEKDFDGDYCRSVNKSGQEFEIIIVDGRDRVNCLIHSIDALTADGVLILDDSHEPKYQEAFSILENNGFRSITISGIKPYSNQFAASTIFYKSNNCLKI
jgi:hypothetical protein